MVPETNLVRTWGIRRAMTVQIFCLCSSNWTFWAGHNTLETTSVCTPSVLGVLHISRMPQVVQAGEKGTHRADLIGGAVDFVPALKADGVEVALDRLLLVAPRCGGLGGPPAPDQATPSLSLN